MDFSYSYRKLEEADIREFEARNEIVLPQNYVVFLLYSNGGRPDAGLLHVPGWKYKNTSVSFFFGIKTGDTYDLEENIKGYSDRIPKGCLAIGDDSAGNLLLLELGGEREGNILFWDHENEPEHPDTRANVLFLADDINELLKSLRKDS
jgi:hypothetical protein